MEDLVVLDIFQVYHIFEHDLGLTPTLSEQVFDTDYDGIDAKLENNMFMHKSETVFHIKANRKMPCLQAGLGMFA